MALLEKITSMKQTGMNDLQIVNALKEEGITPREISEALSQMRIKSAVASEEANQMEPSIMQTTSTQGSNNQQYTEQYPAQDSSQNYNQEYADPNYYSQTLDLETIRDVAKQESEEAIKKIKTDLETLNKFKTENNFELQNLDNRITKIENIIQELQTAIIRKIGEYGEAVSTISQDLRETQKSFSKVINPLLDKKRGIDSIKEEQEPEEPQDKPQSDNKSKLSRSKDSASFEDYFR